MLDTTLKNPAYLAHAELKTEGDTFLIEIAEVSESEHLAGTQAIMVSRVSDGTCVTIAAPDAVDCIRESLRTAPMKSVVSTYVLVTRYNDRSFAYNPGFDINSRIS